MGEFRHGAQKPGCLPAFEQLPCLPCSSGAGADQTAAQSPLRACSSCTLRCSPATTQDLLQLHIALQPSHHSGPAPAAHLTTARLPRKVDLKRMPSSSVKAMRCMGARSTFWASVRTAAGWAART